jgi:hypothetical protein
MMRMGIGIRLFVPAAFIALVALVPSEASAGDTVPLSSIAALPRSIKLKTPESPTPIPGLSIKTKEPYAANPWIEVSAATGRGYCMISGEPGGGFRWMSATGSSSRGTAEDIGLVRLVEKDGKVTLERTDVRFDPANATLTASGRSHVELREVARTAAGIVVWAYRDGHDIVVLTRRAERGVESQSRGDDGGMVPFVSAEGCPFAGARIDARKPEAGAFAQLSGDLPAKGTGKEKVIPRFLVDASVSRVARDPEPKLAVRVRIRE